MSRSCRWRIVMGALGMVLLAHGCATTGRRSPSGEWPAAAPGPRERPPEATDPRTGEPLQAP